MAHLASKWPWQLALKIALSAGVSQPDLASGVREHRPVSTHAEIPTQENPWRPRDHAPVLPTKQNTGTSR